MTQSILISLALISSLQTFLHTSPYAHLVPPFSSIFLSPLTFFRESWSVFRLHLDYTTEKTAHSRAQNILDAQKRRLYRRAHGMEDLDAQEDQGVDVRGLVPWDDGLTNPERARGGRRVNIISGREWQEEGKEGETFEAYAARKRDQAKEMAERVAKAEAAGREQEAQEQPPPERRRRKLWLGIW